MRARGNEATSSAVMERSFAASARYSFSSRLSACSARASNAASRHRAK